MDDLAFLRERIESYADYTNDDNCRLCDEQIRAYVGEALAKLRERLGTAGSAAETLDRLVLRCQFANQTVIRAFDKACAGKLEVAQFHELDRRLIALADRTPAVLPGNVEAALADIQAELDERDRALIALGLPEGAERRGK